jgi:hypothetical protein
MPMDSSPKSTGEVKIFSLSWVGAFVYPSRLLASYSLDMMGFASFKPIVQLAFKACCQSAAPFSACKALASGASFGPSNHWQRPCLCAQTLYAGRVYE